MSPWGKCPNFANQEASWIWYLKDADKSAPGGTGKIFVYIYENNNNIKYVNINCIADDKAKIYVNNKYIGTQRGGWGSKGGVWNAELRPGTNIFSVEATNAGTNTNPAGLLMAVINSDIESMPI